MLERKHVYEAHDRIEMNVTRVVKPYASSLEQTRLLNSKGA